MSIPETPSVNTYERGSMTRSPMGRVIAETTDDRVRVGIPQIYIHATGDIITAAVLQECIFWSGWSDKTYPERDGWFYRTADEWHERLRLSRHHVTQSIGRLSAAGVETKRAKVPSGGVATWYRVDMSIFESWIVGEMARVSAEDRVQAVKKDRTSTDSQIELQRSSNSELQQSSNSYPTEKTYREDAEKTIADAQPEDNSPVPDPETSVPSMPRKGPAQTLVATLYEDVLGIGAPTGYKQAVGQAQALVKAGCTPDELREIAEWLLSDSFWAAKGITMGLILSKRDNWRSAKNVPAISRPSPNGTGKGSGRNGGYTAAELFAMGRRGT